MDLSNYQDPILSYRRWFYNGGGQGSPNDSLVIEIDNGITTVRLNEIFATFQTNVWTPDTFELSNFIAPTSNVTVTFRAGDYGAGHLVEAAVDAFQVYDRTVVTNEEPLEAKVDLEIYPNPVGDQATVRFDMGRTRPQGLVFELRDVMGRVMTTKALGQTAGSFELNTNLPGGIYFGSLRQGDEVLRTVKILK